MISLSPKQKRFVDFVQRYSLTHGHPPSYEEIRDALGFSSLGTVNWYVQTLTRSGFLTRTKGPNGKRALTLTPEHAMPTRLPLLGLISAGTPIEAMENPETVDVPAPFVHPDNFVLRVRGNSMIEDNIEDGDYVVIRKTAVAQPGQTIVALINGDATLKRYYPTSSGVELHPRNPHYPVLHVTEEDDFRINGVVLFSFRSYA